MLIQNFGIKFPFMRDSGEKTFVDLNKNRLDKVTSQILHVIMTPKGERLKMPDFGTNLIKYIYEPNDKTTWGDIINEAREEINKYVKGVVINSMDILESEDGDDHTRYLEVKYSVEIGNTIVNNKLVTKI